MGATRLPAFQFYPADWLKDPAVRSLTLEERGFWIDLLAIMSECEHRGKLGLNGGPYPPQSLALWLGMPEARVKQTLTKLLKNGVASLDPKTGIIYNRRMVRDEWKRTHSKDLSKIRAEAGRLGGLKSRKQISKIPSKSTAKQAASSSSSSSSSNNKKGRTPLQQAKQVASIYQRIHNTDNPRLPLPTPYEKAMWEFRDALEGGKVTIQKLKSYVSENALGKEAQFIIQEVNRECAQHCLNKIYEGEER